MTTAVIGISTSAFAGQLLAPALERIAALAPSAEIRSTTVRRICWPASPTCGGST